MLRACTLGLRPQALDFRLHACFGFALDASHFAVEGAGCGFFGRRACFLDRRVPQRFGLGLGVARRRLTKPFGLSAGGVALDLSRMLGFGADALDFLLEAGFRFRAHAGDLALDLAGCLADLLRFEYDFGVLAAGAIGFRPQPFDFLLHPRFGVGGHTGDLALEGLRCGLFGGGARFDNRGLTQRLGFRLRPRQFGVALARLDLGTRVLGLGGDLSFGLGPGQLRCKRLLGVRACPGELFGEGARCFGFRGLASLPRRLAEAFVNRGLYARQFF